MLNRIQYQVSRAVGVLLETNDSETPGMSTNPETIKKISSEVEKLSDEVLSSEGKIFFWFYVIVLEDLPIFFDELVTEIFSSLFSEFKASDPNQSKGKYYGYELFDLVPNIHAGFVAKYVLHTFKKIQGILQQNVC